MSTALANFYDSLGNGYTRAKYRQHFEHLEWTKAKSPDRLVKRNTREIEDSLRDYIAFLKKKYAKASVVSKMAAVRKFYSQNRVNLNWDWINSYMPTSGSSTKDRDYTTEELRRILQECDTRQKAILLTLMSGMREGGIASYETKEGNDGQRKKEPVGLKVGDLAKITSYKDDEGNDINLDSHLYKMEIYSYDEYDSYYCYSTFEAARAIDDYLKMRTDNGEIIAPDSWLFIKDFEVGKLNPKNIEPLTRDALSMMFTRLLRKAGIRAIGEKYKRKQVMLFHGIRKTVNSRMVEKNLNFVSKEAMLGHSTGLEKNYLRSQENNFLREWLKAIPLLTVSAEEQARRKVAELEVKVSDVDELKSIVIKQREEIDQLKRINALRGKSLTGAEFRQDTLANLVISLQARIAKLEGKTPEPLPSPEYLAKIAASITPEERAQFAEEEADRKQRQKQAGSPSEHG